MRMMALMLAGALVGGCAAGGKAPIEPEPEAEYGIMPAAALVFDSPVGRDLPPGLLGRDGRGETAYWGLRGPTTTYHYVRTDDRWGNDDFRGHFGDTYRRRAIMMELGVSVRP